MKHLILLVAVVAMLMSAGFASAQDVVYAINCGGDAYTAVDGTAYIADDYFINGETYDSGVTEIAGTEDDELYRYERYEIVGYALPVENGDYSVTLKFAEVYDGCYSVGTRVFDVSIEGVTVISALDIFAEVGQETAYDRTFDITVSDGSLDIGFTVNVQAPAIKAILVTQGGAAEPEGEIDYPPPVTEGAPVAGMLGLGLVAAACALGGAMTLRKK